MKTAGKIEVRIPAVVDPQGRVNAAHYTSDEREDVTDVGILYDSWWNYPEDHPTQLVHIKATIDLDAVFASHEVDGQVDDTA